MLKNRRAKIISNVQKICCVAYVYYEGDVTPEPGRGVLGWQEGRETGVLPVGNTSLALLSHSLSTQRPTNRPTKRDRHYKSPKKTHPRLRLLTSMTMHFSLSHLSVSNYVENQSESTDRRRLDDRDESCSTAGLSRRDTNTTATSFKSNNTAFRRLFSWIKNWYEASGAAVAAAAAATSRLWRAAGRGSVLRVP
ncbi:hypothetical protein ANTPLA_LOCUS2730 [Anthophora plagiata]